MGLVNNVFRALAEEIFLFEISGYFFFCLCIIKCYIGIIHYGKYRKMSIFTITVFEKLYFCARAVKILKKF